MPQARPNATPSFRPSSVRACRRACGRVRYPSRVRGTEIRCEPFHCIVPERGPRIVQASGAPCARRGRTPSASDAISAIRARRPDLPLKETIPKERLPKEPLLKARLLKDRCEWPPETTAGFSRLVSHRQRAAGVVTARLQRTWAGTSRPSRCIGLAKYVAHSTHVAKAPTLPLYLARTSTKVQ